MSLPNPAADNAPITAASITAAVALLLANFTTFTASQITALTTVVGIVAAVIVQRFHTEPRS